MENEKRPERDYFFRATGGRKDTRRGENIRPPLTGGHDHSVDIFSEDGELRTLEDIQKEVIRLALAHYGKWGRSEVARRLNIGRSTLYRLTRQYGIE